MTAGRGLDLAVLVLYLAAVVAWGLWMGRGARGGTDYFLGDRDLPWPAVLLSVVATETSALTFLSVPGIAYAGTLGFLQLALGYLAGRVAVALLLLPRYYRDRLATAYQLLEERFGRPTRRFTSGIFMLTRLLADSVRLFATAIPLALFTGWSYPVSVGVIAAATLAYTWAGGIRAVVWVDVVQMGLYVVGGGVALVVLGQLVAGGWPAILETAGRAGKLRVLDLAPDPGTPYTLWAGLVGGAFLSLASHGTDQLMVQRLLSCRDLRSSQKAVVGSGVAVLGQFALFLLVGVGLWALYGEGAFPVTDQAFPRFIVEELPPGLSGLLVAGVFAVAMSTLSSSINSLSSAWVYDFMAPAAELEEDDPRLLRLGRWSSVAWAAALTGGALAFVPMSRDAAAVEVALGVASLVYGGLLGAFALALFRPRARGRDAVGGMIVGIGAVVALWIFARDAVAWPWYGVLGAGVTWLAGAASSRAGRLRRDGAAG